MHWDQLRAALAVGLTTALYSLAYGLYCYRLGWKAGRKSLAKPDPVGEID